MTILYLWIYEAYNDVLNDKILYSDGKIYDGNYYDVQSITALFIYHQKLPKFKQELESTKYDTLSC